MRGDIFAAGIMAAIFAFLLALSFGFLDSGGGDDRETLEWGEYLPIDRQPIGTGGSVELVTIDGVDYIHAKETGNGNVTYIDGTQEFRVMPAHVDMVLMDGQSNAAYFSTRTDEPDPSLAIAPEIGTAWYFGRTEGRLMTNDLGQNVLGFGIHDMIGQDGSLRIGDKGPTFSKYYHDATGHKVLWISLGIINQAVASWEPGNSCWKANVMQIDALKKALQDAPLVIDSTFMMWAQGESDKVAGTTIQQYKERFTAFWTAAQSDWGLDIDACYLISGRTYRVAQVNDAFKDLAAADPKIKVAVPASVLDAFTVDNDLMKADNMHYTQQGDNAVAASAARFIANDRGFPPIATPLIYLMEESRTVNAGATLTGPSTIKSYRINGSIGYTGATWTAIDTSTAGKMIVTGTTKTPQTLRLPYAIGPILIVTVQ